MHAWLTSIPAVAEAGVAEAREEEDEQAQSKKAVLGLGSCRGGRRSWGVLLYT